MSTIDRTTTQQTIQATSKDLSSLPVEKQLIARRSRQGPLYLSLAQERLWFLDQLEIDKAPFNTCGAFRLKGPLNVTALGQALRQITERHEVLRTTFVRGRGQPEQNIHLKVDMDLPLVLDMSDCPPAERTAKSLQMAASEAQTPFDLEFGPLFYAKLLAFSHDEATLLINGHQSVFDEHSIVIVMKELAALYNAYTKGETPALPEPAFQYKDYALWQRQLIDDGTLEQQVKFWKDYLADAAYVLELPADHPRPVSQTLRGATVSFDVPARLFEKLQKFSREVDTSLATVLFVAFNVLLFRYTGREDLLAGYPADNRLYPDTQGLVGLFNNLLVVRSDLSGGPTFRELLVRVEASYQKAAAHQDLPFEKLLEALRVDRDLSRAPLVQLTFEFEDRSEPLPALAGLRVERLTIENWLAGFDLSLLMKLEGERLTGAMLYATDLFKAETMNRLIGHYLTLLEGAVIDADQPIYRLPLLTIAERQQMLDEWNATDKVFEKTAPVYQLFEDQVVQQPNAIAAIDADEQVTYQELNRRANRLAHFLVEAGMGPDMVVALLAERSIDYLTAILAIHKAGGAFLPLDPRHPAQRLAQILQQSETPLVLASKEYLDVLNEAVAELPVDKAPKIFQIKEVLQQNRPEDNLPLRCEMKSLAYVMFTSGSSGLPKGVMVEHLGMLNHNWAKIEDLGMSANDILAQIGPQSFDIMVWQFVAPLIVGAKVHIFRDEIAYNPLTLMEHIQKAGITILQLVPAFLNTMVQEANATGNAPDLSTLRWVVPTGEALPTELCRQWLKLYPHIPLLNTYGSTECSDDQCHYPIHDAPPPDYPMPIMTIGTPIRNMRMYILDPWLQPVPVGAIGELYVGGIGVGRGYLKDLERTGKAFIADPFAKTPDARLYKTGDQGRYMPDGTIEFLGRSDHMVKIRGFRIELGEIDAVLSQHPAIKHSVVITREDAPNNKYIVAYYVVDAHNTPGVAELRTYMGSRLPDYMIPTAFVQMEALPLTANGKIDRKNLPAPDLQKIRAEAFVAPRNETEQFLATTWAEVLGVERVGIHDNFFELGGHSLLAIRIFSRIDKKYNRQLPLGTLFRAPTIEQLARLLEEESAEDWSSLIIIQDKGDLPPFFCVAGGVIHMRNLSHYLGTNQPLYALQTETLEEEQLAKAELDQIARESLKEVRAIQPHGPYYIGGCFGGGTVALAMAQQLIAEGEEVALMAAFNTLIKRRERPIWQRALGRLRNSFSLNPVTMYRRLRHDVDWENAQEWVMGVIWKVVFKFYKLIGRPLPRVFRTGYFGEMLLRQAANTYKPPETYNRPVTLFVANEWYDPNSNDPTWGWGKLTTGEVQVHVVPGDPCTIFTEPNVYVSAQTLKLCLEKAREMQAAT